MIDLLVDRSVLTSVAVAVAIVVAALAAGRITGVVPLLPPWLVWVPAFAVALAVSEVELGPALSAPDDPIGWTVPVAAGGAGLAIMAAFVVNRPGPAADRHRQELGLVLAAAAIGVFACVPETGVLRTLPGPVTIAAAGAFAAVVRPFGPVDAIALAATLGWLAVIDGQSRPASVVGAAACLTAVGLILLYRPDGEATRMARWLRPAIAAGVILAIARLAGTLDSVPLATTIAVGVLALAAGAILANAPTVTPQVEVASRHTQRNG